MGPNDNPEDLPEEIADPKEPSEELDPDGEPDIPASHLDIPPDGDEQEYDDG